MRKLEDAFVVIVMGCVALSTLTLTGVLVVSLLRKFILL